MSILAVGSIAFDSIATPSGRVENVLGGSCTFFSLAASYFTDVRIVAVVVEALFAFLKAVLFLPARILRGPTAGRTP